MAFEKGHTKQGGRPKGGVNKITASVKDALARAFEGLGGVESLIEWGKENRSEFYKLWIKLLPTQITGEDGEPIRFSRDELSKLSTDELLAMRAIAGRVAGGTGSDGVPAGGEDRSGVDSAEGTTAAAAIPVE